MTITDEEEKRALRCPGYEDPPLPRGFMMAVAQNMHAMETYASLSKEARERLLHEASLTRPGEPMRRLVDHMSEFADSASYK
ncbi:MAG: hypothetical protein IJW97_01645 [Clostridia bacterium]|nr:hypothetical protein [Clostridia bacterium]